MSTVPEICTELSPTLNYASWQNSVPLISSLRISQAEGETLSNLELRFSSTPGFARPRTWTLDRLTPEHELVLSDRRIELDGDYLNGLNEAERGEVVFELWQGDTRLTESRHDIRVLARDEWGGLSSQGEMLSAFVMPNDPVVAKILKQASKALGKSNQSSALDGYQTGDPRRAFQLVAAIWTAVAEYNLTYANPPASFEDQGQKVRRPSIVISEGLATCLDSTLLFAAAVEAVGLNPVVMIQQGHSFVGAWLVDTRFRTLQVSDPSEVRKAIAAKELLAFETTMVTNDPPATLPAAVSNALEHLKEYEEHKFVAAIDIVRARMAQIRPLASHEANSAEADEQQTEVGPLPLPDAGEFGIQAPREDEPVPQTPRGRIDRWQRKLLDLSLRNRLLNFRFTKQTIPFLCPNIPVVEDKLADGTRLRIVSLPEENPLGERDAEIHLQETNQDLDVQFASEAIERNELATKLHTGDLSGRLTTMYRKARNDLAEGGSNTLFLAIGFLRWKREPTDKQAYRAPLILVPVTLSRLNARSPYELTHRDDEVRFNATLIQMVSQDFELDLSGLERDLPKDASGVDVPRVLDIVRRVVRELPGFEVIDETALSTFSFAKYLMWKDLVDRVDQLRENRVVRHLIEDPDKPFESAVTTAFPAPREMDVRFTPDQLVHPLPADSSQLAAVTAAADGQDFVLIGPPGTGKSQTIANMIAQCLAHKKTVLFVAEKTAALDVVYRRLRERGLGNYCIELHSNKAERRNLLAQLKSAWEARTATDSDWKKTNRQLQSRRDQLNAYVAALHATHPNGWSVFKAMGITVNWSDQAIPQLDWPDTTEHDRQEYEQLEQTVEDISRSYDAVAGSPPLNQVKVTTWSVKWEAELISNAKDLRSVSDEMQAQLQQLTSTLGLPQQPDLSLEQLDLFTTAGQQLLGTEGKNYRVIFHKQFGQLKESVSDLQKRIAQFHLLEGKTVGSYSRDQIAEIPVEALNAEWQTAVAKFWPLSFFAKRAIKKQLLVWSGNQQADPQKDLPSLHQMQQIPASLQKNALASQPQFFKGLDTDAENVLQHLEVANTLRKAVVQLGKNLNALPQLSSAVAPLLSGDDGAEKTMVRLKEFLAARSRFVKSLNTFKALSKALPFDKASTTILADSRAAADGIVKNKRQLKKWTGWVKARKAAKDAKLHQFVQAISNGEIDTADTADTVDAFRVSYAQWWLPTAIDSSDPLREFEQLNHAKAIGDFCLLDDEARQAASGHVLQQLAHDLPSPESVARKSELGLLRHQTTLKRPSKTIREIIEMTPNAFNKLAPCMLMSPISIAQYLPTTQQLFDVVIFDEASQITTWDAIGAIARGRQTVIVGDPKQLPPTNFFGRSDSGDDDSEIEDHERDLESILDEARASGLPTLQLNWHYRSQHESLIAFSNWHYYNNELVTFPAAVTEDNAVRLVHLPHAVYDRSKSLTNRIEADAIVADGVSRMQRWLELAESERPTLGVITFNSQQQSLIQDLFDQAQRDNPEIEWFFAEDRVEPTAVKNLENVQGDERDVMLFSINYGPKPNGTVPLTFGALNRDGGERRLNVAVTRARQELVVYCSFKAEQLNTDRSKALGVKHLKNFLDYADRGPIAMLAETTGSVGDFDSPFEQAVAERLKARGWEVVPQVGVSDFRIDLGIVHPQTPGRYLAGVECDGATYHRSATARDRDKTREQMLRHLGWQILRVWSPDWWYDTDHAIEQLHQALNELLDASPPEEVAELEVSESEVPQASEPEDEPVNDTEADSTDHTPQQPLSPTEAQGTTTVAYKVADLSGFETDADRFFDSGYNQQLRSMAMAVLAAESPVREDVLVQRVARAHEFARTGSKIRDRVLALLNGVTSVQESPGRFLWQDTPAATVAFRGLKYDDGQRTIDQIALAELTGLIVEQTSLLNEKDPALAIARCLGISRLKANTRQRIQEAIAYVGKSNSGESP